MVYDSSAKVYDLTAIDNIYETYCRTPIKIRTRVDRNLPVTVIAFRLLPRQIHTVKILGATVAEEHHREG
jgi:hypothetical protein